MNIDLAFKDIINNVIKHKSDDDSVFFALYKFVQNSFFHHPTFQITKNEDETDNFYALKSLISGAGRCGQVSNFANCIYTNAGFKSRIIQLYSHICCEVLVDKKWLLVDADSYKAGFYPKNLNNKWADLNELRENPHLIDQIPAIGMQLSENGVWAKNKYGNNIQGYHDIGLSWDKHYLSHLFFGCNKKFPLKCLTLKISHTKTSLIIKPNFYNENLTKVIIYVASSSRGWAYEEYPSASYITNDYPENTKIIKCDAQTFYNGVSIEHFSNIYFINVFLYDNYAVKSDVYVWPSNEIKYEPKH